MNSKEFSIVALRLFGIYCIIEPLLASQTLYYLFAMPEDFTPQYPKIILASLVPSIILVASGIVMLACAPRLAKMVSPNLASIQSHNEWTLQGFQSVLISLLGLYIFTQAIPPMFQWVSQLVSLVAEDQRGFSNTPKLIRDTWTSVALTACQMVVAIGLFFGARGIAGFWSRAREWTPNKQASGRT